MGSNPARITTQNRISWEFKGLRFFILNSPRFYPNSFEDEFPFSVPIKPGQAFHVRAEIILSRYERFSRNRCLTHFTTNLSANEIEERYGPRVRSRLREMCNLIAFPASTPDKRK
ncbi:MAG: hypothetical protein R6U46_04930 [Marinilabilia sp.]